MWQEIQKNENAKIDVATQSIKNGAPHYQATYSKKKLTSFMEGFDAKTYWYNDGIFQITLVMYVLPDGSMGKIANCLVSQVSDGIGDEKECVKIVMRKVREYMDANKMQQMYALTPNSPFTPFQDKFHDSLDTMIWEHSKALDAGTDRFPNGIWRRTLTRDPERTGEDELWTNKGQ